MQDNQCPENCEQNQSKIHWQGYFFASFFVEKIERKIHHVEIYPGVS